MKKDFQQTIKAIRESLNESEFPKAMMTERQMAKNTATVNCEDRYYSQERSKARAEKVITDSRFQDFLKRHNATATIEYNSRKNAQIRINY